MDKSKLLQDATTLFLVLQRVLGTTGTSVMSRIFGLLLAALAMQAILDGLRPHIQSLC